MYDEDEQDDNETCLNAGKVEVIRNIRIPLVLRLAGEIDEECSLVAPVGVCSAVLQVPRRGQVNQQTSTDTR